MLGVGLQIERCEIALEPIADLPWQIIVAVDQRGTQQHLLDSVAKVVRRPAGRRRAQQQSEHINCNPYRRSRLIHFYCSACSGKSALMVADCPGAPGDPSLEENVDRFDA